jgi:acetyl esterase/lipase
MRHLLIAAVALAAHANAQTPVAAISADPVRDVAHPARLVPVRYPTGGVMVPARMFVAAGAGAHPTVLLLHGFPGTELNLDLARVLQRAGWNVLAIHYRGVWGAPGQFSFSHVIDDAHAALAWLRSSSAVAFGVDPKRIVALGHSMGGFATVMLGDDPQIAGFAVVSAADMGARVAVLADDAAGSASFADDASYTNASVSSLIADGRAHRADWDWSRRAKSLAGRPVLTITSDDGLAPAGEAVAAAVVSAGGTRPTLVHMATDHSYNDRRIELATAILQWLNATFRRP